VQKWWSIVFGAVLFAELVLCMVAPLAGWWLPENVASFGGDVDDLFYIILAFTGFFFVLTEAILVYAMYRYAYRPGHKAVFVEGNHRLELAWTVVPALILLFIAFAQVKAWERIKYRSRMPAPDLTLGLLAQQWEWRLRYPADPGRFHYDANDQEAARRQRLEAQRWAESPQADDVHLSNELHVWQGANVKVYLRTRDVIHSFGIPNLRLMQDILPGKTIPMWFQVTRANTRFHPDTGKCEEPKDPRDAWEIACKELCGGRHYAMRGRLYVHPDKDDYERWLKHAQELEKSRSVPAAAAEVALNQGR
jgi:cytochrome c oxidase subunit 2